MKKLNRYFLLLFLTLIINLFLVFSFPCFGLQNELVGWYHGASGYEDALELSKENESPLVLFFYRDSDTLSQKLDDTYFTAYAVYSFLDDIPKADINLEGNEFEAEIAKEYDIEGDSTLLIIFPFIETDPVKITPFFEEREMTPEEFTTTLRNAFSLKYNETAHAFYENGEYKKALKYYNFSIKYDPERAYSYFAIASVYHTMVIEEKGKKYKKEAEEYYKKALELDPEFIECKEELKKLYENILKLRRK